MSARQQLGCAWTRLSRQAGFTYDSAGPDFLGQAGEALLLLSTPFQRIGRKRPRPSAQAGAASPGREFFGVDTMERFFIAIALMGGLGLRRDPRMDDGFRLEWKQRPRDHAAAS